MRFDAGNLRLQLHHACIQFVKRIAVQTFARKQAGGIAAQAWLVIVVHDVKFGRIMLAVNQ